MDKSLSTLKQMTLKQCTMSSEEYSDLLLILNQLCSKKQLSMLMRLSTLDLLPQLIAVFGEDHLLCKKVMRKKHPKKPPKKLRKTSKIKFTTLLITIRGMMPMTLIILISTLRTLTGPLDCSQLIQVLELFLRSEGLSISSPASLTVLNS